MFRGIVVVATVAVAVLAMTVLVLQRPSIPAGAAQPDADDTKLYLLVENMDMTNQEPLETRIVDARGCTNFAVFVAASDGVPNWDTWRLQINGPDARHPAGLFGLFPPTAFPPEVSDFGPPQYYIRFDDIPHEIFAPNVSLLIPPGNYFINQLWLYCQA